MSPPFYSADRKEQPSNSIGQLSNRDVSPPRLEEKIRTRRGITMKKFGFASVIATGFVAAVIGLAAPAQADLGHHDWVNQVNGSSNVVVPHVNTDVHN
jgi:hypothetical protein